MSKWYKVTTVCQVLTDYIVWADSDEEARDKMLPFLQSLWGHILEAKSSALECS